MNKNQKEKRNFRASKIWKAFRKKMMNKQKGIDPITKHKLYKGWNLHHRHVTADTDEYQDISNEEHYVCLNKQTHEFLHWGYTYYKKYGQEFLDLIKEEWEQWF